MRTNKQNKQQQTHNRSTATTKNYTWFMDFFILYMKKGDVLELEFSTPPLDNETLIRCVCLIFKNSQQKINKK
jgi:hypothetical protein